MGTMPRTLDGGRWRILALLIGNGFAQAAAAVAAALSVERAFGMLEAVQRPSVTELAAAGGVLAAAAAATAALRGRERVDAERLGQAYTHRLRIHLFEHLTEMSARTVGQKAQGSTAMRFVGDLTVLRRWVSRGLARVVVAGTMASGALVALAFVSAVLAISVGVTIVVGASLSFVQGGALRSADRHARRRRSRLAGNVNEKIGAIGVVQANGAVDRETRRMTRQSRKLRDAMVRRAGRLGRLDAIAEATASVAIGAVLITGVLARVAAPTVAAAMVVVGLLSTQVRGLGRVQEYWQGACVSREAIQRFLDRPTMQRDANPVPLEAGPGRLEIEALTLEGAIVDVDAVVEAGSTVAIVGPNGAGKSTLLALVARMVDPDSGTVRLDGQDLATASIEDVRDAIGFVAADLPLLRGSLRRNLTYRQPKADDGEIADIATRCGLDGLIGRLDEGYESRIAEGGRDLSSGERQRVLLARALLGHPPVLLLDEADANLDPATTGLVDRVLREYDGTTLIVTHRHQRLASADAVWFIDDGHLVESGPPDVLLDGDGPTARFFGSVPPASTSPEPSVDAGH